jgi:hypothetical protein
MPSPCQNVGMTPIKPTRLFCVAFLKLTGRYYSPYVIPLDPPLPNPSFPANGSTILPESQAISKLKKGGRFSLPLAGTTTPPAAGFGPGKADTPVAATSRDAQAPTPVTTSTPAPRGRVVGEMLAGASSKRSGGNEMPGRRLFVCYVRIHSPPGQSFMPD